MPLYVSFQRKLTGRTMLWYEPLEEEGVGHEALHEVVNDSYKHITRSSQRRMSIQRIRNKDGWFHATFMKGSAGRPRSERLTPLITKIMHEHLPTDARMEMSAQGGQPGSPPPLRRLRCVHAH